MRTPHTCLTLCGSRVEKGILVSNGQVPFSPGSGLTRHDVGLLAATPAPDGDLEKVYVAITAHGVVLVPCEEVAQKELVLVRQYCPGTGSKRYPSFHVNLGPEVRQLSSAFTSGGGGGAEWVLVSAPLGWAQNIAAQFINARDFPGQTISFKPGYSGRQENDVPSGLFIAFKGDEDRARRFIANARKLDISELDEHEMSCGRARKGAEVVRVSNDPEFFLGADPNDVVPYIFEVHFPPKDVPLPPPPEGGDLMGEALRQAGLIP